MSCAACNYNANESDEKSSRFGLPKDQILKEKWLKRLPASCRNKLCVRVCSIHFEQDDFQTLSQLSDGKSRRG